MQRITPNLWFDDNAEKAMNFYVSIFKDKFGMSWQVVPNAVAELMADEDPEKAMRVMQAILQMDKIEIEPLRRAYDGTTT